MNILIITGPAGAGKNTIGYILAKRRRKCAVIDVDLVRWMLCQPNVAPWAGSEGIAQQKLSILNTSVLAANFAKEDCDVVILDVVTNDSAQIYKDHLFNFPLKTVLLLPTYEETQKRLNGRSSRISEDDEKMVYEWQKELKIYDLKIDNTTIPVEEVVKTLNQLMNT